MKILKLKQLASAFLAAVCTVSVLAVTPVSAEPVPPLDYFIKTEGVAGSGDFDGDGTSSVSDLVTLQKHLTKRIKWFNGDYLTKADVNHDGVVNVYDSIMMKHDLLGQNTRQGISWKMSEVLWSDEYYDTLENDYIFTSADELSDYIYSIYGNHFVVFDIEPGATPPSDPYSDLEYEYRVKYDDSFFENNILLLKPILQNEGEKILHDINRIYFEGDTLNIDYTRNYDSLRSYPMVVTPLFAEVAVPKSLWHGGNVSWNYHAKDWELGVDEFSKGPIEVANESFTYTDGKNTLEVSQVSKMFSNSDCATEIVFRLNGRLMYGELIFADRPYAPFNNNGDWLRALSPTGECISEVFTDNNTFEIYWGKDSVKIRFTADKKYSYEFDYEENITPEPVLMETHGNVRPGENGYEPVLHVRIVDKEGNRYSKYYDKDSEFIDKDAEYFCGNYEAVIENSEKTVPDENKQDITAAIAKFAENAEKYKDCEKEKFDVHIDDFGSSSLYVLYNDENGVTKPLELFHIGNSIWWLDEPEVQEFVKLMADNGYYNDAGIIEFVTEGEN